MRILLTKISNDTHTLEIVRSDGSRDRIELVTREALYHDFVHHAVESSMRTQGGFWGALASGKTFADLNDRSGEAMKDFTDTLYSVEAAVGMMTGALKSNASADEAIEKLRWYHETQDQELPGWLTANFVADVCERMRRLEGKWKATPFGGSMEIDWVE